MGLADDIKKRMFAAMKAGLVVEKEILRVATGEITMTAARTNQALTDEEVQQILKKLLKSNREALAVSEDAEQRAQLEQENGILSELLPQVLSVDEICSALAPVLTQIQAAPQLGPALGIAMKQLKLAGLSVEAPQVNEAVTRLRG